MKWYKGIVDNDEILSLNEGHIEEGLDQNNLQEITIKYYLGIVRREYLSPPPPPHFSNNPPFFDSPSL